MHFKGLLFSTQCTHNLNTIRWENIPKSKLTVNAEKYEVSVSVPACVTPFYKTYHNNLRKCDFFFLNFDFLNTEVAL